MIDLLEKDDGPGECRGRQCVAKLARSLDSVNLGAMATQRVRQQAVQLCSEYCRVHAH